MALTKVDAQLLNGAVTADSSGNVGIGTASPSTQLELSSATPVITVNQNTINSDTGIKFKYSGNTVFGQVTGNASTGEMKFISGQSGQNGYYQTFATNGTERMRIDSSGNVGIGAAPSSWGSGRTAVQLYGSSTAVYFAGQGNTLLTNNYFYNASDKYIANGGSGQYLMDSSSNHIWYTAPVNAGGAGASATYTERMRINSSGNVGIGTTTPSNKVLTVGGTADISCAGGNGGIYFGDAGTPAGSNGFGYNAAIARAAANNYHISTSVAGDFCIAAEGGKSILFGTYPSAGATTERMRIDTTGRVLVGVTSGGWGVAGSVISNGYGCRAGQGGALGGNGFNIYWNGNAQLWIDSSNIGNIAFSSDYRIKRNIETQTESGIEKILKLRPVTYQMADYGDGLFKASDEVKEGFIAHEVQEVIPSGAEGEKDEENRIQNLRLDAILSVAVKAIQELKAELDATKAEVAALKAGA